MTTTITNTLPRHQESTIYQGRPWEPVVVRFRSADGTYEDIEVQAHIVTAPVSEGGELVTACAATLVTNKGWAVTLDPAATRALPTQELYAEVMVKRAGQDWKTAIIYTLTVESEISVPVVSIEVTGDGTIAVGEITSLVATATYDDDSEADVTAECVWTNAVNGHAEVVYGNGYVHGASSGVTQITAAIGSVQGTKLVTVA